MDRYGYVAYEKNGRKTVHKPTNLTRDELLETIRAQLADMTIENIGGETIKNLCHYLANPPLPNKIPVLARR